MIKWEFPITDDFLDLYFPSPPGAIDMIGAVARRAIFWSRDFLTGSHVRRHLRNIQQVSKDTALLAEHQARQLKLLLDHAVGTTDFFSDRRGFTSVNQFPVINKNIIREADGRLMSKAYRTQKLKVAETSGSRGSPLRIERDSNKCQRLLAEVVCFNSLIGYKVGTRYAWTIPAGSLHRANWFSLFVNNKIELSQYALDSDSAERHRNTLVSDNGIKIIMGYSSVIFDLARHIIRQGTLPNSFGVKGILCISEPLYPNMRKIIHEAFGCPVLSRYSNEECGVLAYECPACGQFHLNTASYFFEILGLDNDEPVLPGDGGRIVVTDMYNFAMPVIRYDTGDIGAVIPSTCAIFSTPVLKLLEEHNADFLYDTSGRRLLMFVFDSVIEKLCKLGKVNQFQLIQEGRKNYLLKLSVTDSLSGELDKEIIDPLMCVLGANARIDIEYTDEIHISGKRKYIASNYIPEPEDIRALSFVK